MSSKVDAVIEAVLGKEGAFSDHPSDTGGATMWGITEVVARADGYAGPMRSLPRDRAKSILLRKYVTAPGFASIIPISEPLALELVDTGVNMGVAVAGMMLQRSLNALSPGTPLKVDGQVGMATISALNAFLAKRGKPGERVLLKCLNCLQGERYIDLAEKRPANEDFLFGWMANRVELPA